jgi:hypothetical protein
MAPWFVWIRLRLMTQLTTLSRKKFKFLYFGDTILKCLKTISTNGKACVTGIKAMAQLAIFLIYKRNGAKGLPFSYNIRYGITSAHKFSFLKLNWLQVFENCPLISPVNANPCRGNFLKIQQFRNYKLKLSGRFCNTVG